MGPEIRDNRQMRALTGVPNEKFEALETAFAEALADEKQSIYQKQVEGKKGSCQPYGKN